MMLVSVGRASAAGVPATQYVVSFDGTANEDVTYTDPTDPTYAAHEKGNWSVKWDADPVRTLLWLPRGGTPSNFNSSFLAGPPDGGTDSGSMTATVTAGGTSTACTNSVVSDRLTPSGQGAVTEAHTGGAGLVVETSFAGFPDVPGGRQFDTGTGIGPNWTCGNGSSWSGTKYPPDVDPAKGGNIDFSASVPASGGGASFTLPAQDHSTINGAPAWATNNATSTGFGVSGTYTFTKKCDGTVSLESGTAIGQCGATAGAAPNTKIKSTTVNHSAHSAKFKFSASGSGKPFSFECKIDKGSFKKCKSPKTYKKLKKGKHTFSVRAKNSSGKRDKTPAKKAFKI